MQVMLRRELTSRLTYPNGKFRRFLDIPRMEVQTLNVGYTSDSDKAPYIRIAERLRLCDDADENRTRILYLHKAGLCPKTYDIIKRTQGQSRLLWAKEDGVHSIDVLKMGKILLPAATIDNLFPKDEDGMVEWPESVFQLVPGVKLYLRKAMQRGAPKMRYLL